jgi:hypothetical protein
MKNTLEPHEAGGKVGDPQGVARIVFEDRFHDGRVAHIRRLGAHTAVQDDFTKPLFLVAGK